SHRNRRTFLKALATLGAASAFDARSDSGAPAKYAHRFQLSAEGLVTDFSLVWPTPELPPLPPGAGIRLRLDFPIDGRDLLEWQTSVDFAPGQSALVTLYHVRVERIILSAIPAPNFGLFGPIVDNPVVDNPNHSPFGDLTGRVGMIYGQFDEPGENVTF